MVLVLVPPKKHPYFCDTYTHPLAGPIGGLVVALECLLALAVEFDFQCSKILNLFSQMQKKNKDQLLIDGGYQRR